MGSVVGRFAFGVVHMHNRRGKVYHRAGERKFIQRHFLKMRKLCSRDTTNYATNNEPIKTDRFKHKDKTHLARNLQTRLLLWMDAVPLEATTRRRFQLQTNEKQKRRRGSRVCPPLHSRVYSQQMTALPFSLISSNFSVETSAHQRKQTAKTKTKTNTDGRQGVVGQVSFMPQSMIHQSALVYTSRRERAGS